MTRAKPVSMTLSDADACLANNTENCRWIDVASGIDGFLLPTVEKKRGSNKIDRLVLVLAIYVELFFG